MDKEWIALIGTLAGAMIAGTAGFVLKYVEYNNLARREERKQMLEKLELIHEMLYSLPNKINRFYIVMRVLRMKSHDIETPEDLLENFELKREQDSDFHLFVTRLASLIKVYASEYSNESEQLLEKTIQFWKLIPDYKEDVLKKEMISNAQKELAEVAIDLSYKVSEKIRTEFFNLQTTQQMQKRTR
jgi:hypothetical protein